MSKERLADALRRGVRILTIALMVFVSIYPAAVISNGHPGAVVLAGLLTTISFPICVLAHELGHAVAAWLVGWRVHLIVVGSRAFAPRRRKFFRISEHDRPSDIGGWVNATPPAGSPWNEGELVFTLGGVTGNLLLSAFLVLLMPVMRDLETHLYAFLVGFCGVSLVYAVTNLVPISRPSGWDSDGAKLIRIVKGELPSTYEQKLARLSGMLHDGVPFEEWDVPLLNDLIDGPPSERGQADPILISYTFGMADLDTTRFLLERYLTTNPDASCAYHCMHAFTIAMVDRDAPRAAEILEKLSSTPHRNSFCYWRTQAVIAHLLGNREEALAALRKALHFAARTGAEPDDDDEAVFQAIEEGRDLPRLEPRQRLAAGGNAFTESDKNEDARI